MPSGAEPLAYSWTRGVVTVHAGFWYFAPGRGRASRTRDIKRGVSIAERVHREATACPHQAQPDRTTRRVGIDPPAGLQDFDITVVMQSSGGHANRLHECTPAGFLRLKPTGQLTRAKAGADRALFAQVEQPGLVLPVVGSQTTSASSRRAVVHLLSVGRLFLSPAEAPGADSADPV